MVYGLITMGISAAVFLILTTLFRIEQKKEQRILLGSARAVCDRWVVAVERGFIGLFSHVKAGVVRTTIHYIMHHVLGGVISALTRLQKKLFRMYEKNRWQHHVSSADRMGDAHLSAIAEHKKETALTTAQKKKMRKH